MQEYKQCHYFGILRKDEIRAVSEITTKKEMQNGYVAGPIL